MQLFYNSLNFNDALNKSSLRSKIWAVLKSGSARSHTLISEWYLAPFVLIGRDDGRGIMFKMVRGHLLVGVVILSAGQSPYARDEGVVPLHC